MLIYQLKGIQNQYEEQLYVLFLPELILNRELRLLCLQDSEALAAQGPAARRPQQGQTETRAQGAAEVKRNANSRDLAQAGILLWREINKIPAGRRPAYAGMTPVSVILA